MEKRENMKNVLKKYFSYKLLFVYLTYAFLLTTAMFTRSFLGISLFGFRIGELVIGFALILTLYFFFYPKPNLYFDFGSRRFFIVHKLIVLYVLLRLILNFENINLYQFKSSSFIWTISIIYFGIYVSNLYKQNNLSKSRIRKLESIGFKWIISGIGKPPCECIAVIPPKLADPIEDP